jgi:hypothetical protein
MNVIEKVNLYLASSEQRWDAAIETDDSNRDFESDRDACIAAYKQALEYLEDGEYANAIIELGNAADYERIGGDDQDASSAILAVYAAWDASI